MNFLIAATFTDSLGRLTNDEQKAVKTTAFDLQVNPESPGLRFHRLDKSKDPNFWSISVNMDIRLIVHKTEASLLLCYVDHHDEAYRWAERRKLATHPKTGAAQLIEVRETIKEVTIPRYVQEAAPVKPLLFAHLPDAELLGYGVPVEWLEDVRKANENTLLELADHLPSEAAEALLDLATGGRPEIARAVIATADPFEHPDAKRRFRVMNNVEELERALEFPWEKWTIFLHPAQRQFVEADYNGPVKISGSAGTGKTIVALHRAVFLARQNPESRILLTTFSATLANILRTRLRRLISNEPRIGERLEVHSLDAIAQRLYRKNFGRLVIASREALRELLSEEARKDVACKFRLHFLISEWDDVIDALGIGTWEDYRDVRRLGRKTRLPEAQRLILWLIFDRVRSRLKERSLITLPELYRRLASHLEESGHSPFEFCIADESQDLSVPQLRFLAALGGQRPNSLFFAGDLGQRIFQQPFSWKSLGVDIRGRSRTLRINYRTSHQIRLHADRLLGPQVSDVDGNIEDRRGTFSVFNGPAPTIEVLNSPADEIETVARWISSHHAAGFLPHEIAIFIRSENELARARAAVEKANLDPQVLDEEAEVMNGYVSISTMHLSKGLEFRAVAVMGCDDDVLPLQERIETVSEDAELEEVYNTERHLLYVACTRARDQLLVTGVAPGSEFLEDMAGIST